jgi:hypothetical protein
VNPPPAPSRHHVGCNARATEHCDNEDARPVKPLEQGKIKMFMVNYRNLNNVMECRDHSKNSAGMKSQMCKVNNTENMRKVFITFLLTIFSVVTFAQARLGSTATDIRAEFWESHYKLKSGYNDDKIYYITIETEKANVVYYFNTDKVCTMVQIIPDNQGALNYYVELYNKQYVIVSSKKWKMYANEGIANIDLIYPEGGGYYFLWYRLE